MLRGRIAVLAFIILSTCNLGTSEIYAADSHTSKSSGGSCFAYNGTICSDVLGNRLVYIRDNKPISKIEKKLLKWFKTNKQTGQITKECWPHAKALTCSYLYPECSVGKNAPTTRTTLCSQHCRFMNQNVCKGEFKRARISVKFRQFLPLCEEVSLVDDSDGRNCFFLPTVNFSKAPEPYAESEKRYRRPLGKTATLKCIFGIRNFIWNRGNSQMITEGTWYFKNRRIVGSKRVVSRTIHKGSTRLFMQLKIRNVSVKDEGLYQCVITFANKTVRTTAQLSIYQKETTVTKIEGKCVAYTKGFCANFFMGSSSGNLMFEKYHHPLGIVDSQIEMLIKKLSSSNKLSQKCLQFGQPVLCYHKFQKCVDARPVASLCKRDCELFKNVYCREELLMINTQKGVLSMYIPDCNLLPDHNANCISIPQVAATAQMPCSDNDSNGNYQGTMSVSTTGEKCDAWNTYTNFNVTHNYCRNHGEKSVWCYVKGRRETCDVSCHEECYEDRGLEYHGTVSQSISGRKCLPWNAVTYRYSNVAHSYCRNFEGDMEAPWCYTDYRNSRELCDVPKCIQPELKSSHSSLMIYVVPAVIGATAILISFFIFLFCVKRKKIMEGGIPEDVSEETVSMDKHFPPLLPSSFHTISTTASLDFNKDSPPSSESQSSYSPLLTSRKGRRSSRKNVPEVKEGQLYKLEKIGDGKLGQLWQGEFVADRNNVIPIVVRKLKPDTKSCVASAFRTEMNALRTVRHPHIQQVVCVSALSEIPFIAFEDRCRLDLKEFLKGNDYLDIGYLVDYVTQISYGLEYLHARKILHKDVAARNMVIYPDGNVQISKSGLGMYRYPDDYKHMPGVGLSPVRWLSPECLQTGVYKQFTDVYMFGVLIWETFSLGAQPYGEHDNDAAIEQIIHGCKLMSPVMCPSFVWDIAEQCTAISENQRPSISLIREIIETKGPGLQQLADVRT